MKNHLTNETGGALVYVLLVIFSLSIFMPIVFSQLSQDRSQTMRITNEVKVNQVLNTSMNSYLEKTEILQSLCGNKTLHSPSGGTVQLHVTTRTLNDQDLSCQETNQAYKVVMEASADGYSESITHMVNKGKKLPPWIYVENLGGDRYLICGFTPKWTNYIDFDIRDKEATLWNDWDSVSSSSFSILSNQDIKNRLTEINIADSSEQEDLLADLRKSLGSYLFFLNYQYGEAFEIQYSNSSTGEVSFQDHKGNFDFYAYIKEDSVSTEKIVGGTSHFMNGDRSDRITSEIGVSAANGNSVIRIGPDGDIEYIEMEDEIDKPSDETLIVTNSVDYTNTKGSDIDLSAGEVVIQDLAALTVDDEGKQNLYITSDTGDVVIKGSLRNDANSKNIDGIKIVSAKILMQKALTSM